MIRVPITVLPRGNERDAITIATVEIENDQTGDASIGHYRVRMRGVRHVDATIRDWPRARGEMALVAEAMRVLSA